MKNLWSANFPYNYNGVFLSWYTQNHLYRLYQLFCILYRHKSFFTTIELANLLKLGGQEQAQPSTCQLVRLKKIDGKISAAFLMHRHQSKWSQAAKWWNWNQVKCSTKSLRTSKIDLDPLLVQQSFHLEGNSATALKSHKPPPTYSPHPRGSGGHTLSCGVMKLLACLSPTSPPHPLKFPGYLLSRFLIGCPALSFVLVFMSLYFCIFFQEILKEKNAL